MIGNETVHQCRRCEYDLTGLARKGFCPECGSPYNVRTGQGVVGGPADKHRRGDRIAARIRTILIGVAILVVMSCGGALSWVVSLSGGNWLKPVAMAGLFSAVLLMAMLLSYLNEKEI